MLRVFCAILTLVFASPALAEVQKSYGTEWSVKTDKTLRQFIAGGYRMISVVQDRDGGYYYFLQKDTDAVRCYEYWVGKTRFAGCLGVGDAEPVPFK